MNHQQLIDDIESALQPVFGVVQQTSTATDDVAPAAAVADRPAPSSRSRRQPAVPALDASAPLTGDTAGIDEPSSADTLDQIFTLEAANEPSLLVDEPQALIDYIHQQIRDLLGSCGLASTFTLDDCFEFGCHIEVPDFDSILKNKDVTSQPAQPCVIDYIHPQAGFIWWFLCDLCGQRPESFNFDDSPVYQLPETSTFRGCVSDDARWYQLTTSLIGDPPSGVGYLIDWLTLPDSTLRAPLQALLNAVHLYRNLNLDGRVHDNYPEVPHAHA